ncbi:DNA repair exonuclease [Candidatus Poribacteria bacterium]|jgi:DNA repair protein SbcD/Mre11|nr:DNA repair exonuclease [Candidatus Poribacteria bacterium]
MTKFIHAADLHLDSPLRGLDQYEGAPVDDIRGATRRAAENLVDLAIEESVDFLLIAGDIYDGDWRDYNTGLFFLSQMSRLREVGARVFFIRGNHDAASQITRSLQLPDHVREFSIRRPETIRLDDLGVAIHGQGFSNRAIVDDLSQEYPSPVSGMLNIGMLHTSATGREGHDDYAPCTVEGLRAKGYDYWALGHVHTRETLSEDPWIVFPGNTQGRHIRETGPKGCTLVTATDGRIEDAVHMSIDVMRWERRQVDATGARSATDALERASSAIQNVVDESDGLPTAIRVTITGASDAHAQLASDPERWATEIRALATDVSGGSAWIEKVRVKTEPVADWTQAQWLEGPLGGLIETLEDDGGAGMDDELVAGLQEVRQKIPREALDGQDGLDFDNPTTQQDVMADVKQILLTRLTGRRADA